MNVDMEIILLLVGIVIPTFLLATYFYYDQRKLDEIRNKKKKAS